jgi:hypothetical protein
VLTANKGTVALSPLSPHLFPHLPKLCPGQPDTHLPNRVGPAVHPSPPRRLAASAPFPQKRDDALASEKRMKMFLL